MLMLKSYHQSQSTRKIPSVLLKYQSFGFAATYQPTVTAGPTLKQRHTSRLSLVRGCLPLPFPVIEPSSHGRISSRIASSVGGVVYHLPVCAATWAVLAGIGRRSGFLGLSNRIGRDIRLLGTDTKVSEG